jgi:CRISPR-associated protein Csx17
MTIYEHVLDGCAPMPLAGYLKALGVFRLVAEQADPGAQGFWRNERFVLRTVLSEEDLVGFLAGTYEPSPIISPWNGRAGFLEGESAEDDDVGDAADNDGAEMVDSLRKGAQLIRWYESTASIRFRHLRDAVRAYRSSDIIKQLDRARADIKALNSKAKEVALSDEEKRHIAARTRDVQSYKRALIQELRSTAPEKAIDWLDACQRITMANVPMPLLGSGGNDGSRDFGMNFGLALFALFDFSSGKPLGRTVALIRESLGFDVLDRLESNNPKNNLGLYEPGGVGENTTTGFGGHQPFNPFDIVLLLEGAVLFLGAATRRLGSSETRLSFPFTAQALTAGTGAAASVDDGNFAEFWAPLWNRNVSLGELRALLNEGRVTFSRQTARDGLEFAVAVNTLGAQRGIPEFQRFALLQREPKNPKKATPLGRVYTRYNPRASLVGELNMRGWLSRARMATRAQASLVSLGRQLDESLFRLVIDESPESVQRALIAIGALALACARRPKLRKSGKNSEPLLPPPPSLSDDWVAAADDGSPEFALAAALGSLNAATEAGEFRLPFRTHLGPLGWSKSWETWDDKTGAQVLVVWTGHDLLRDMAAVLERRLVEAQRRSFVHRGEPELPLRGWRTASLASVAAFLAARTDDDRIAALAAGLAWVRMPLGALSVGARENALPFAFAALKPLFEPAGIGPDPEMRRRVDPLPLVRLLRAGRTGDAILFAQRLARGAGLPAPFARLDQTDSTNPARLAAGLLFPIAPMACDRLIERAYPDLTRHKEEPDAA